MDGLNLISMENGKRGQNARVGVVVSSQEGAFVTAFAGPCLVASFALHVQLIATRSAAIVAQQLGLSGKQCMFEGDSVVVIVAVNDQGEDCSPLNPIINDVRVLINDFSQITFQHVKREANQIAHRLARTGMGCSSELVQHEEPSDLNADVLVEYVSY